MNNLRLLTLGYTSLIAVQLDFFIRIDLTIIALKDLNVTWSTNERL